MKAISTPAAGNRRPMRPSGWYPAGSGKRSSVLSARRKRNPIPHRVAMIGSQTGTAVGELAREVIGSADIGLPLGPEGTAALLPAGVAEFGQGLSVDAGEVREVGSAAACFDPRPDPTGSRVAFVGGTALKVVEVDGSGERVVAADPDETVSWGRAEFVAAEEMGRYRGYWWSPDGQSLLVARVDESPVAQW